MSTAKVEAYKHQVLERLNRLWVPLETAVREAEADQKLLNSGADKARVNDAPNAIQTVAACTVADLRSLVQADRRASDAERLFRDKFGITRELKRPNLLGTTALISTFWTIETAFTAVSLVADGHVEPFTGLGFGATFSTVNVGLGLGGGYLARHIGYREHCLTSSKRDRKTEALAIGGVSAFALAHLLMVFVGGRTRVLGGEHAGIFDFSEVGFLETFNDGLALVIMVSAVLSFLMSALKGYGGLTDPIPGYADHAGKTGEEILRTAREIVDSATEEIEEIAADAEDDLQELWSVPDDLQDLLEEILKFNSQVDIGKDDVRVRLVREWEERCIAANETVPRPRIDFSAFDALKIEPDRLLTLAPHRELMDTLHQARAEANSTIMAAFAAFTADTHRGVVLPPFSELAE